MNDKPYQKEYEEYMKNITDQFACYLSYKSDVSLFVPEGERVPITWYQYKENLLEYDTRLKHLHENKYCYEPTRFYEIKKQKQKFALQNLMKNKLTYDEFVEKYKTNE